MNGSFSGSVSFPRTPGAAMLRAVFVVVLYESPFAVGGRLVLMMTVLEAVAEQPAAFVTVTFNVRLANAPAVNVILGVFVALVIVPLVIVQAYVAAPVAVLAVLPVEFGLTLDGVTVIDGVGMAFTVTLLAADAGL